MEVNTGVSSLLGISIEIIAINHVSRSFQSFKQIFLQIFSPRQIFCMFIKDGIALMRIFFAFERFVVSLLENTFVRRN